MKTLCGDRLVPMTEAMVGIKSTNFELDRPEVCDEILLVDLDKLNFNDVIKFAYELGDAVLKEQISVLVLVVRAACSIAYAGKYAEQHKTRE
jgi:hypothetical protein